MAFLETIRHQPSDRQDYDLGFDEKWPDGDPVSSVVVSCVPSSGLTLGYAISGQDVKLWVGPGAEGVYAVQVVATSAFGRAKDVDIKVKIKEE